MSVTRVTVDQPWQREYVYELTAPPGERFHTDFQPDLTPREMLSLGVFGGCYFPGPVDEFPPEWFEDALIGDEPNPELNFFGVEASLPLSEWQNRGWIHHDDPLGWFQWYCRYYLGRRMEDDARQIKRWKAMRRHVAQIIHNCQPGDINCRRKQRQALLHWAYNSIDL